VLIACSVDVGCANAFAVPWSRRMAASTGEGV
jgi:hypothetical protein